MSGTPQTSFMGPRWRVVIWGSRWLGQKIPPTPALSRPESWKCRLGMSVAAVAFFIKPSSPLFDFEDLVQQGEKCTLMKLIFENIF